MYRSRIASFNGTYRFLCNALLIRLVCPPTSIQHFSLQGITPSHEAAMADARTQIDKSLMCPYIQTGIRISGFDEARTYLGLTVVSSYLVPWIWHLLAYPYPTLIPKKYPPHDHQYHSKDLKSSAAPQTPNAPYAIQVKFGPTDWTIDRLKRMTSPRDPISPDTYPK